MLASCAPGKGAAEAPHQKLRAVPFTSVKVQDAFWSPRLEVNRTAVLPANIEWCEKTGRISNFAKAGKLMQGKFEGIYFNDSDVYKMIEGAAYTLQLHPDPQLEAKMDEIIDKIAAAQQPDGYINTYYTLVEPKKRWSNLPVMHEMYCAGHMMEAAVAYAQATRKKKLLDVACRMADCVDGVFGPNKRFGFCGHEEIELALVKLYRQTGQERYLRLAEFFVEARGKERKKEQDYMQAHMPVAEQTEIVGHAVRAMYLYCAVADIAGLTGDARYFNTMDRIWRDVVHRKMYITGGIGPSAHNEGFTVAYDLPNDTAYAETCASIGMALWNHRLALLHADGCYVDVLERVIYNGFLSGVALDGRKFFYVNPLASRGQHHRQPWFGCACCPTNVVRFLPQIGGYIYAEDDEGVWVNLYIGSEGTMTTQAGKVVLSQEGQYPWSGQIKVAVTPAATAEFNVNLRIPGWCPNARIQVNGAVVSDAQPKNGYVRIRRTWRQGDVIQMELPMDIQRMEANQRVSADVGRIAIQRGPIVYCLEAVDNGGKVRHLSLPRSSELKAEFEAALLGGVTVIKGLALAAEPIDWNDRLYAPAPCGKQVEFKAVPYYAWDNREPGEMVVWLPEAMGLAERPPIPTKATRAKVSVSHCNSKDSVHAVNDEIIPAGSNDQAIPRLTWWDHKGTTEWVEYAFAEPTEVSSCEVYWFDDSSTGGGCGLPRSWRILWKKGEGWEPVAKPSEYGTQANAWNRVTFESVTTRGLRLEVILRPDRSGGILEWRVP